MRPTSTYDSETKTWVPSEEYYAKKAARNAPFGQGPMVIRDIEPYRSTLTGKMVTSRSEHRSLLKAHGCIEVGNERLPPKKRASETLPPVGPDVKRAIEELGG